MEVVRDSTLCAKLQSWKDSGQFCDLTMLMGEETVKAHACIVAAALPPIQELLMKTWKSGAKTTTGYSIRLDDLCQYSEVVQGIVDHVYGRGLEVNQRNVLCFLKAAASLKYDPAVEECLSFMVENVTPQTALTWYNAARECNVQQASSDLLQYINERFGEIAKTDSFLQLPRVSAEVVVPEGKETCLQQQKLFKRAISYVEDLLSASSTALESYCEHAIILQSDQHLGLPLLEEQDDSPFTAFQSPGRPFPLLTTMNGSSSFKKSPARQLILEGHNGEEEGLLASACVPEDKHSSFVLASLEQPTSAIAIVRVRGQFASLSVSCQYPVPRGTPSPTTGIIMDPTSNLTFLPSMREGRSGFGCAVTSKGISVFGGYNRDGCLCSAESYTEEEGWNHLPGLTSKRGRLAAASVGGTVYAIGGSNGMNNLSSVEVYCPDDSDDWSKTTKHMVQPRSQFAAVAVSNTVYAIGGSQQSQALQSVECLDVASGVWSPSKAMTTPRAELVAVEHDGDVYAIGGTNYRHCLASVERFNALDGTWEPLPAMTTRRRGAAAVSFEGRIYVFGGCDGRGLLRSVEIFSPESNTWSEAPSMAQPRCGAQAVVYKGSIYILGGYSTWGFLTTMERYVPASQSWSSYC